MKHVLAILLVVVMLLGAGLVSATPAPAAGNGPNASATTASASAPRFDAEAATDAYMAQLSPQARASSDAYFEGGYWWILWDLLVALAVAWLLLGTRLSARMRDFAERITRFRWLQTAIYVVQYILVTTLLTLPRDFYEGFVREHQYGLSNLNFGQWLNEQANALLIILILGMVVLVIIYAVIRKATRTWWLWGAGVAVAFMFFLFTIAPLYLFPVFIPSKPLPESPLKAQILSMARANGIPATDVYLDYASHRSKRISASVAGMFGTTQISLNDNLMNRSTPAEVKAMLGHEIGHYVLNHIYEKLVFVGILIVFGSAFMYWGFGWAERRWGARWGIRNVGDVAGLPLLVALCMVSVFFLTPVYNTISRSFEAEADAFGLNAARQPDGFAEVVLQLSEYRKMRPGPVEEFVFFDHPSGWNRVHRAMVWKAEHLDDPDIKAMPAVAPATSPSH
jgi:STE24 endopeptidase